MIDVAIIGATGYTGAELLSILSRHPDINVKYATSSTQAGRAANDLFPELGDDCSINFSEFKNILGGNSKWLLFEFRRKQNNLADFCATL